MSIQEFYTNINGDYEEVMHRLQKEDIVLRFVERFAIDGTYFDLVAAVKRGDMPAGYAAAHKLKGLVATLAFTDLYNAVSELTDRLCSNVEVDDPLMQRVAECYQLVLEQERQLIVGSR